MGNYLNRLRRDPWRSQGYATPPRSFVARHKKKTIWEILRSLLPHRDGVVYARRPKRGYQLDLTNLVNAILRIDPTRLIDSARRLDLTAMLCIAFVVVACGFLSLSTVSIFRGAHEVKAAAPVVTPAAVVALTDSKPAPPKKLNILLLGSDQRKGDGSYRTDVILLLSIDLDHQSVSAVSFPRDLWVKVPKLYEMKINMVQALGGFDITAGMFEANFGVKPDYYVMTNFTGFTEFIDNRGGIDVEVGQELTDDCDLPQARNGDCTVTPGTVHMDGATALWYVRSRHTTSDLDRLRRAQEVVYGVFKSVIRMSPTKFPEMQAELGKNFETNLSMKEVVSLLPTAIHLFKNPDSVKRYSINEDQATEMLSWNGMWILLPDEKLVRQYLIDAGVGN